MAKGLMRQKAALQQIAKQEVHIGWFPENVYPDGTPVAAVMAYNEFGSERVPARPLMRQTSEIVSPKVPGWLTRRSAEVLEGKRDASTIMQKLGENVIVEISKQFDSGNFVPNAPSTEAAKGFNKPLIDTGHLSQTPQYKVKEGK